MASTSPKPRRTVVTVYHHKGAGQTRKYHYLLSKNNKTHFSVLVDQFIALERTVRGILTSLRTTLFFPPEWFAILNDL